MIEATPKRLTSQPKLFSSLIVLFFIWGFITLLNDLLVPVLKQSFSLNYTQAMLIQFAFFLTYFIMSLPMANLLDRWQYKKAIIIGLIIIAVGSCCFIPADLMHTYPLFLLALFVLATGVVMLQVSANPLVTLLGATDTASARLTLAQAINSFGYVIAPIIVAGIISAQNLPWIYLTIALVMLLTALFIIGRSNFTNFYTTQETVVNDTQTAGSLWKNTPFVLSLVAIFLYVGAEVSAGSLVVNYLKLPQIANFHLEQAAKYLSFFWGGAMIGRFIGSYVLAKIKAPRVLLVHTIANLLLLMGIIFASGKFAMWCLLSLGLFNSIMFPAIFSLGILSLPGKHLKNKGSGWLIMAIVGGAVIPVIQGYFADHVGLQHSFFVLLFNYAFIGFFAIYYSRKAKFI